MNALRHRPAALCGLGLLVLVSPPATRAEEAARLDPVVVTAARLPQPASAVLSDLRVIDAETIRNAGSLTLTEVLQAHGGVEIVANGGAGQLSGVFLRGTNSNHVVVLVDGVRINAATSGTTALEHIPLEQIERIEVLRSPASSLYGADAIGGVIQIFTRDAERTTLRLGAGRWSTRTAGAGFGRQLGDTRVSLQAGYGESESFSATGPNSAFFDPDRDPYRNANLGLALRHAWAPGQELAARVLHSAAATRIDCGGGAIDRTRQRLTTAALESRNRLAAAWTSTLRVARGADHSSTDAGACIGRFDTDQDQFAWQHDLALPLGTLALGLEWRREAVDVSGGLVRDSRITRSLFASYAADAGPHLLQAALRRDDDAQFGGRTSGTLGYGYRLGAGWRASGQIGTAFKAPSFNDLYVPLTNFGCCGFDFFYSGNPDLRPERARSYEAALRYEGGAARAGLTLFANRIRDLIANGTIGSAPVVNTVVNVNRARIRGATLDGSLAHGDWTLRGAWTHQDPEDAQTGDVLPRRARRHGSAGIEWAAGRWRSGADLVFSGARHDALDNRPDNRLGGYGLVHLHAGARLTPEWSLSLRLNNAGDKRYELAQGFDTPRRNLFVALDYAAK